MDNNYFFETNKLYLIFIIILICIFFLLHHFLIGGILLILYIFFVVYNVKLFKRQKHEWKKFFQRLSSKIDTSTRTLLINSPFSLAIISTKGNILWYNQKFFDIFNKKDILGKNIENMVEGFKTSDILDKDEKIFNYIKIGNKFYNIYISINDNFADSPSKDKVMVLYFYDVTYQVEVKNQKERSKESIMLMEVDNLDDVLKTTEDDKALLLSAEIERVIKSYAQSISAMIIKYSSSKYVIVTQYNQVQLEMKKNFDILDEIREINYGNKLAVTLSVGVGCGGESPLQDYEYAVWAKDLALSRGGDQVVIKNKEKLEFYGGKTKEVEKRTKVKARVIAHALVNLIKESSNVYIMGHFNPDIDAIGAAIGIWSIVKSQGKEGYIILDNSNSGIDNAVERLKKDNLYNKMFTSKQKLLSNYDNKSLLVVVDANSKEYIQDKSILENIKRVVVIDHHRKSKNAIEGTLLSYIEPYASSTCELVTEMLPYMIDNPRKYITQIEAEMLLAGIYVDTKNFYFKTGVRTFEAAAYLRQLGADIVNVKKMFAGHLETYVKKAEIMSRAEVKNDIAIAICPEDIKDNILAAQVADELLNIAGVQASFVLAKIDNEVFISGRSFGDINVQIILETLGGGGHMTIAGAKVKDISIDEAKVQLKQAIDKYLREGEE